jgi:hypothetical protein
MAAGVLRGSHITYALEHFKIDNPAWAAWKAQVAQ